MNQDQITLANTQLKMLGHDQGTKVYLRAIHPQSDKPVQKLDYSYPLSDGKKLKSLQSQGYGLFFVVNDGGHDDKSITAARAIWYEHDELPKPHQKILWEQKRLPEPSFQLDTGGKSIHTYWVFDQPYPDIKAWRQLQADLLAYADADKTIKNPSRVMRLAGSRYCKGDNPDAVATIITQSDKRYSFDDLRAKIPSPLPSTHRRGDSRANGHHHTSKRIPLERLLSKEHRDFVEHGVGEGSRNHSGFALAVDAIGVELRVPSLGIDVDGTAKDLIWQYGSRCNPPLDERELESIYKSAERSNPKPCLDDNKLLTIASGNGSQPPIHRTTPSPSGSLDSDIDSAEYEDPADRGVFLRAAKAALFSDTHWICWQDVLHRWNGTHYEQVKDSELADRVWQFCTNYQVREPKRDGSVKITYPFAAVSEQKGVIAYQKQSSIVGSVNPPGFNCDNGFLELSWQGSTLIKELKPHSPDRYVLTPPVCEYNPKADPSAYEQMMECLDPEPRTIWERTIAASIDLATVRKHRGSAVKAALLKGHGANGKDTLRSCVERLMGPENIANASITDWQQYDQGSYFKIASTRGRRLSWASETADIARIHELQGLKAAITGDPVTYEPKYGNPEKEAPSTVFLFSINAMPNLLNAIEAVDRRWGVIPFNKTYSVRPKAGQLQADPRFKEDAQWVRAEVLPAMLNQLLDQLQAVVLHGIDYSSTAHLLAEFQRERYHLLQFAEDMGLEADPDGSITVQELWAALEQWYQEKGYLTIDTPEKGSPKKTWIEPSHRGDRLCKGPNNIPTRFMELYPQLKRSVDREAGKGNTTTSLIGLSFCLEKSFPKLGSLGSQGSQPAPSKDPKNQSGFTGGFTGFTPLVVDVPINTMSTQGREPSEPSVNPPTTSPNPLYTRVCEPCEPSEPTFQKLSARGKKHLHPYPVESERGMGDVDDDADPSRDIEHKGSLSPPSATVGCDAIEIGGFVKQLYGDGLLGEIKAIGKTMIQVKWAGDKAAQWVTSNKVKSAGCG